MSGATKPTVLLVIAFTALAAAQTKEQPHKPRPAPEMQRLAKMLVGTWKVDEDWAVGGTMANGGKGTATSVIRPGPGGLSLIEDFVDQIGRLHILYGWGQVSKELQGDPV